ncbi:ATP-binding protein [Modestobacter sp. I12A-02662]|uniref:ATP-binding protein n=1 Tax=Modestobacter sp. I12A-02662 TaxID=1730496 RepID=UPI0034DFB62A
MDHPRQAHDGYRHVGYVLRPDDDLTAVVGPVLRRAVAAGEPVVIACAEPLTGTLLAALGDPADVRVASPEALQERPPDALAAIGRMVDGELPADGRRLHLVVGPGQLDDWSTWTEVEALLNHVLADRPVDHLCLLEPADDGDRDPDAVVRATHPWVLTEQGTVRNPDYRPPAELLREARQTLTPDPLESTEPDLALIDLDDMRTLRRALNRVLADTSLSPDAAQDLVLAIDEVTANAAEHGIPPVDVKLWCSPQRVLCAVTDRGTAFDDPLVGYGPAHGDMAVGGMGLWLARRSVDRLTAGPADESGAGCTVRLVVNA